MSSETQNQVEFTETEVGPDTQVDSTRNFTLTPKIQAPPLPPRRSVGPSPLRSSQNSVLQEWTQKTIEIQSISKVLGPKHKALSDLKLTGHYMKIGIPSRGRVYEDRREKYFEMKDVRRVAKELKQEERSSNLQERYG